MCATMTSGEAKEIPIQNRIDLSNQLNKNGSAQCSRDDDSMFSYRYKYVLHLKFILEQMLIVTAFGLEMSMYF